MQKCWIIVVKYIFFKEISEIIHKIDKISPYQLPYKSKNSTILSVIKELSKNANANSSNSKMNFLLLIFSAIVLTSSAQEIAYYEEIKDLPNHPEILLIDVREPSELEQTGQIPTSINIPCQ